MSTDYSTQKVAELQDLLKERGLPHTGKKADLVARLQESDTKGTTTAAPSTESEPASAPKADATEALAAAGGKGQPANPPAVPNQVQGEDPAEDKGADISGAVSTEDATKETAATEPEAPKQDFTAGVKVLTLEEELEKRRKRAERFGTGASKSEETPADGEASTEKDDAEKLLDRQKRFGGAGTNSNAGGVESLNQALPERQKGKRGRQGVADEERDNKRRDSRRRDGRGQGKGKNGTKPQGQSEGERSKAAAPAKKNNEQTEKDRAAAEKRKARFAGNAAS